MPFINIKTNVAKNEKVREELVQKVLENTSVILKKDPIVTSILVEFLPFDSWSINEENINTFYLDIKVTKGTNTKEEKANYIQKTYNDIHDILGDITPASYVLIDEVDASSWGFYGVTQEYRYIQSKIK